MSRCVISRRAWITAPLLVLGGCQIAEVRLNVMVQPDAVQDFINAMHNFGRDEGYRLVDRRLGDISGQQDFELVGWRSKIICWGGPATGYSISVRHKDDLWLLVAPDADLSEIAEKVRVALRGRDGIAVETDV